MNDVTSFVTKEAGSKKRSKKKSAAPTNADDNLDEGEPVAKRKRRGRPPKKPVKADSDSDKYEMDLEDEDVDDPDIALDDYNVNKISSELKSKNAPGGKKKEFENENEELLLFIEPFQNVQTSYWFTLFCVGCRVLYSNRSIYNYKQTKHCSKLCVF